jgi:hypothetical protein
MNVSSSNKISGIIWFLRLYFLYLKRGEGGNIPSSVLILPAIVPARGCMGVDCLACKRLCSWLTCNGFY